jgi:hypothetical protein
MSEFTELKTKKARIAFLKVQLGTKKAWAIKGLQRIYERQTADEKASQTTNNLNSVGFSGADAEILSSFAEQTLKNRALSDKQMAILFKKMPKYARQLESISVKYQEKAA